MTLINQHSKAHNSVKQVDELLKKKINTPLKSFYKLSIEAEIVNKLFNIVKFCIITWEFMGIGATPKWQLEEVQILLRSCPLFLT